MILQVGSSNENGVLVQYATDSLLNVFFSEKSTCRDKLNKKKLKNVNELCADIKHATEGRLC